MNEKILLEGIKAQLIYVMSHKLPLFAPSDGKCYFCSKVIYTSKQDVINASDELITSCKHCKRSFLD